MDARRRIEDALARPARVAQASPVLVKASDLFAVPKNLRGHYDYQLLQMAAATTEVLHATATESIHVHAAHPDSDHNDAGTGAGGDAWIPRHERGTSAWAHDMLDAWFVYTHAGQGLMLTPHGRLLAVHAVAMPDWCGCRNPKPGVLPGLRRRVTLTGDLCVGLRPDTGPTMWINTYEALARCAAEAVRH